jgi:RNA polymerase sigma-70 factor (ECF subfamily)
MIACEAGNLTAERTAGAAFLPGWSLSETDFARVIEPHLESLRSAALAILHCEHHAWDAVQETLLALWRESELPPNLRAWLLRTVTYRSLQLRRCCARRRQREAAAAVFRGECSCGEDPARILDRQELSTLFEAACARLPEDLREVLLLRVIEKLDYEAIARRMAIPVGTVRSRLNRSRSALRTILAQTCSAEN